MGEARNRGTYEQRKKASMERKIIEFKVEEAARVKREKEEAKRWASLTPEERALERRCVEALMGYYSIPCGLLGDYKVRL